jgi:citrate lyase subunit beta/citryl-CoA lyase
VTEGPERLALSAGLCASCRHAEILRSKRSAFLRCARAAADARFARSLGYAAKSLVAPAHAAPVNRALTPSREEAERAARLVAAFEAARAEGRERAEVDGLLVEVPTYRAARRLIARRDELARYEV